MLSPDAILRLVLLVVPLMFSPGPTNFICASTGSRFGVARSVPMILGMDLMVFVPALAVGVGVGGVLALHPGVVFGVQLCGALAILAVAAGMARGARTEAVPSRPAAPMGFWSGLSVQTLNAKGIALLLIVEAEFQAPGGAVLASAVSIAVLLTGLSLLSHFAWAAGGLWLARRFSSPRAAAVQGGVYAAMLALVAVWLAVAAVADYRAA